VADDISTSASFARAFLVGTAKSTRVSRGRRTYVITHAVLVNYPLQFAVMRGIEFEVVWFDQHLIEYQVTCSNGPFRAATRMYLAHGDLSKAAETLSGFPSSIKDSQCRDTLCI
jgi:hypothetical protein